MNGTLKIGTCSNKLLLNEENYNSGCTYDYRRIYEKLQLKKERNSG